MKRKQAFTLIELVVVIIIIGVLAIFGLTTYFKTIEKSRGSEAHSNLAILRTLQQAYFLENDTYVNLATLPNVGLPGGSSYSCGGTNYFFQYECLASGSASPGTCRAYRCTSGGKPRPASAGYRWDMSINGTLTCGAGTCP